VRSGDTLTSIARAQHTTIATMAALNHLSGRMVILIGQKLILPGAPAHVVVSTPQSPAYAASISASAQRLASSADPGPAAIQRMVVAEARRQRFSPALAEAIATQESGFTQRILSPTGAIGVMQLEPETAQYLGVNPYDLASNIRGGITLLRMLEQQMGSETLAIAAYYEGPTAVRTYGLFSDTKAYVASVQALERRYQ
jgi:soluble lytic murein transglycosylase-like protein